LKNAKPIKNNSKNLMMNLSLKNKRKEQEKIQKKQKQLLKLQESSDDVMPSKKTA